MAAGIALGLPGGRHDWDQGSSDERYYVRLWAPTVAEDGVIVCDTRPYFLDGNGAYLRNDLAQIRTTTTAAANTLLQPVYEQLGFSYERTRRPDLTRERATLPHPVSYDVRLRSLGTPGHMPPGFTVYPGEEFAAEEEISELARYGRFLLASGWINGGMVAHDVANHAMSGMQFVYENRMDELQDRAKKAMKSGRDAIIEVALDIEDNLDPGLVRPIYTALILERGLSLPTDTDHNSQAQRIRQAEYQWTRAARRIATVTSGNPYKKNIREEVEELRQFCYGLGMSALAQQTRRP